MSVGHGAFCKKLSENDECVIYAYSSFNYNNKKYLNDERICDVPSLASGSASH